MGEAGIPDQEGVILMDYLELHRSCILFDGHCDTLLSVVEDHRSLLERSSRGHADLPRLREGGVTAQVFALFARPNALGGAPQTWEALRLLDAFYKALDACADLIPATKAAHVHQAKAEGKLAGIIGLEGAEALRGDVGVLRILHRLGLRNLGLTWNLRNEAADGVSEERTGGGLTEFGVQLVREANRLGIMLDVAHLAPAGLREVLAESEAPVVSSHANARALCDHPRNLTDEQLEAIAAKGGVVGVTFVPIFVAAARERQSLATLLDHVDHMVRIMGAEHVGLGSDFDGYDIGELEGMPDATALPAITAGLLKRGYSPEAIRGILGENWLRVFSRVAG